MMPSHRLLNVFRLFNATFIKALRATVLIVVLTTTSLVATSLQAEVKSILVFHTGFEQIDPVYTTALDHELSSKIPSHQLEIININDLSQIQLKKRLENTDHCVLTVGLDALEKTLATRTTTPIFSTLVSKIHLDNLTKIYQHLGNPLTGIYQEQSFERQLLLSKSIKSDLENIAVILSRQTRYRLQEYKTVSKNQSLTMQFDILKLQESPQQILSRLNIKEGFLLALNDDRHFSEKNLRSLLVSSYKKQIPIIGNKITDTQLFALASVYTPYQTLAQESAIAMQDICQNNNLEKARYARQYKVQTNRQIAKQLGYEYISDTELQKNVFSLEQHQSNKNKSGQNKL